MKRRLLVSTDLSSVEAGVREPDDGQSLIRLMLYLDRIELVGVVCGSNMRHGKVCRPELAHQVVEAYAADFAKLAGDTPAEALHERIHAGNPVAGPDVPVQECVGEGFDTDGSNWIAAKVSESKEELTIAVWGGATDVAQAFWQLKADGQLDVAHVTIHTIGDQDSASPWLLENVPEVKIVRNRRSYRGVYRGGDTSLCDGAWVEANVKGRGALGELYPNYSGADAFPKLGPVLGVKEGDTPSYLGLIDPSFRGWEHDSWSGRFVEVAPNRWTDAALNLETIEPNLEAVSRHRPAFQADFAARLARLG